MVVQHIKFKSKQNIFKQIKDKTQILKIVISIILCAFVMLIIFNPALCIGSIYDGLSVWAKCVLPSLLPFLFFTKILTDLDVVSAITNKFKKLSKLLFNAPSIGTYIFFMSIISGYPVGAKLISEFYESGIITSKQANKLTTFCSTSGPLFIIGSVGTAMFGNAKLGYVLFFSHIIASVLNGLLYRNFYKDSLEKPFDSQAKNLNQILPNSMTSSITSCLIVGGYIAIFFMIIDLCNHLNLLVPINNIFNFILQPIGLNSAASGISSGIIEISKGCKMLASQNLNIVALGTISSFIISFGGLSVFFQATTFLSKCKVNFLFYLLQKITHGILSAVISFALCSIFF